jgi:hypothetical protein
MVANIKPTFNPEDYVKNYMLGVSFFKLFFGAIAWEFSSELYDIINNEEYLIIGKVDPHAYEYRGLIVGISDASITCIGAALFTMILREEVKIKEITKLWICAFIVGFLWQYLTDLACWLTYLLDNHNKTSWIESGVNSQDELIIHQPNFSIQEIGINFIIFVSLQTATFFLSSRLLQAEWASKLVDFQVGFGGFGFYFAGLFYLQQNNIYIKALYAGTATMIVSSIPVYLVIIVKKFKKEVIFQDNNSLEYNERLLRL